MIIDPSILKCKICGSAFHHGIVTNKYDGKTQKENQYICSPSVRSADIANDHLTLITSIKDNFLTGIVYGFAFGKQIGTVSQYLLNSNEELKGSEFILFTPRKDEEDKKQILSKANSYNLLDCDILAVKNEFTAYLSK